MSDNNTPADYNANVFRLAQPALSSLDSSKLHRDKHGRSDLSKRHSSQALTIDVFGSLKTADPEIRNGVFDSIADSVGLPVGGEWEVELEWQDRDNCLNERKKSQIDAVARGAKSLIFFECKFTERDGGSCSQISKRGGKQQCDGNYRVVDGRRERCVLTEKSIRYWKVVPKVFSYSKDRDMTPCPFAGSWYQWMRNMVLCKQVAEREGRRPAFMIAYADSPLFSIANKDWNPFRKELREDVVQFNQISYQRIIAMAISHAHESGSSVSDWEDLRLWVDDKIEKAAEMMMERGHRYVSA
jgi:hypothetical protein